MAATLAPKLALARAVGSLSRLRGGGATSAPGKVLMRLDRGALSALGARLSAALEHAHFLVFHPRDACPQALEALRSAGWSTTDVVTLSQIVAFLTFQIRVAAGLRALAASQAHG